MKNAFLMSLCLMSIAACAATTTFDPTQVTIPGRCGGDVTTTQSRVKITNLGVTLSPLGRLTTVGNLPTGGALTLDGKQYWAVDSGFGLNDVKIVDMASGVVIQTLPLPGAFGGMVFSPDGMTAYVSGQRTGSGNAVAPAGMVGTQGDVIHVFTRDAATGLATEQAPLVLPTTTGGSGRVNDLQPNPDGPAWPVGLAISPDGKSLVVALNMADRAVVFALPAGTGTVVTAGNYPFGAAIERSGRFAYVSNELDGTLTKIDLADNSTTTVTGLGGAGGDYNAHPQNLLADPRADRLYAVVTNRDAVVVIDTTDDSVVRSISLARPEGPGAAPVALALAPDSGTLYVANAGENAIVAIALTARPGGADAYTVLGKLPTADYPHDVQVTPDGCTLVWSAARGLGTGANPDYLVHTFGPPSPYPSYVPQLLTGQVGVLPLPTDAYFALAQAVVDAATVPGDGSGTRPVVPQATPVVGADGGPSEQIKYVFYVVRENRSYDQIFGSDPRGDGDPSLQLFDDNGVPGPTGGITPNAHALSREFVLLDRFFSNSEISAGVQVAGEERADTQPQVLANTESGYPMILDVGCTAVAAGAPDTADCYFDSGMGAAPPNAPSRVDVFQKRFAAQLAAGQVPQFNYIVLPSDHTTGVPASGRDPLAMIADNDQGLGQMVQLISQSDVWPQSVIFVIEDDSQDGADHVDAHRAPALVIGPWVKRGGSVIHTHYNQYSVIRTMELILGLDPLSIHDANAVPMFDVFTMTPDNTPYTFIKPTQDIKAMCPCGVSAASSALSAALPWHLTDAVPQQISDRLLWQRVFGPNVPPPAPGPNASRAEHERAAGAMEIFRKFANRPAVARRKLQAYLGGGDAD